MRFMSCKGRSDEVECFSTYNEVQKERLEEIQEFKVSKVVDMASVTVCARFRPLSSREKRDHGDSVCIRSLDTESFVFKDGKEGDLTFCFDRVFYQHSSQDDVYQFLALPIVRDAINAINGTIITYGQTGAGKTYSMEGPSVSECDRRKKGILLRVVNGLFDCITSANDGSKYIVKLSMVEIYMDKVRDLFDFSKDNLQIKEGKTQGIFLSGATEICIMDAAEALQNFLLGLLIIGQLERHEQGLSSETSAYRPMCLYDSPMNDMAVLARIGLKQPDTVAIQGNMVLYCGE